MVNRSYGGVKLAESTGKHVPFSLRSHENIAQKKQIAAAALKLLHPGETVFIDGSSSAYFVAELLPSVGGITVITNSVDVMSMLSGYDIKAYCTGGEISGDNRAVLVGGYTLDFVKKIRADVAILSVQGISANDGRGGCERDSCKSFAEIVADFDIHLMIHEPHGHLRNLGGELLNLDTVELVDVY